MKTFILKQSNCDLQLYQEDFTKYLFDFIKIFLIIHIQSLMEKLK